MKNNKICLNSLPVHDKISKHKQSIYDQLQSNGFSLPLNIKKNNLTNLIDFIPSQNILKYDENFLRTHGLKIVN